MNACTGPHLRNCQALQQQGIRILNLPQQKSFAVVWKPKGYASNRILVLLHGTGGTAYDGVHDELDMAEAYDVMLVGIQWLDLGSGTYYYPSQVYSIIEQVLAYLQRTDGNPLTAVALSGFSRGAANSYEVEWRDLQAHKYFDLVIAHSGAIPRDGQITPKDPSPIGQFHAKLLNDQLGPAPFAGSHFFLYAGEKDEHWGTEMAENMRFTKDVLIKDGADIVECIIDPEGKHMGYRNNPEYHERSYKDFLKLTGAEPVPVRPLRRPPPLPKRRRPPPPY